MSSRGGNYNSIRNSTTLSDELFKSQSNCNYTLRVFVLYCEVNKIATTFGFSFRTLISVVHSSCVGDITSKDEVNTCMIINTLMCINLPDSLSPRCYVEYYNRELAS